MSNTTTRILTAVIAGPVVLASIWFGGWFLLAIAMVIAVIATIELLLMAGIREIHPNFLFAGILAVLLPVSFLETGTGIRYYHLLVAGLLVTAITELFRNKPNPTVNIAVTFFASAYVGVGIGMFLGIRELFQSPLLDASLAWLSLAVIFSVWMADSFAFFGGVNFGRTKLFPRISPKKTWEGTAFGVVAAVLTMILAGLFTPVSHLTMDMTELVVIGAIIGISGTIGDLIESMIKRDFGVKDSSQIIPGHGGMFDRFDSLILVSPLVYLYLQAFVFGGM